MGNKKAYQNTALATETSSRLYLEKLALSALISLKAICNLIALFLTAIVHF